MQFKQKEGFHLIEKNKQELWQQRISDWEQSGMEIRAWCSKNHIEEQQFHYYKRQLRVKQDTASVPMFAEVSLGSGSSAFPTVSASKEGVWKYYHFHGILSIRYFSTHFFLFCFSRTSSGSWSDHGKYLSNISGAFSWAYPISGSSVRR